MSKDWYIHVAGQQQGPFTFEQMAAKQRDGVLTKNTHVWCDGMPGWALAKDVAAMDPIFSPAPAAPKPKGPSHVAPIKEEASHLIALNPREVDDRTSTIDAKKLKAAKKEAAKALKVADRAEAKAIASGVVGEAPGAKPKGSKLPLILVLLLLVGGGGAAVYLKLVDVSALMGGLLSSIPKLDDVAPEEYAGLKAATEGDAKAKPQAAIALSNTSLDKPAFYVASNLPDGTSLSVTLKADPAAVLSDKPIEIHFPIPLEKHLVKSKQVHLMDGSALPPGEYVATVNDEQDKPISAPKKYFLGAPKDAGFAAKLTQYHAAQRTKALAEIQQANAWVNGLEAQLANSAEIQAKVPAAKKPQQARLWDELNKKWTAGDKEPTDKGYFYPAVFASLHEIWGDARKVHDAQTDAFAKGGDLGKASPQVNDLSGKASQKLSAVKAKLASLSQSLAAPTTFPMVESRR